MITEQARAFRDLVEAARAWVKARVHLRRVVDSKRATEAHRKRAERDIVQAAARLEKAVIRFEQVVGALPKRGIDWGKVAGIVASVAGGVERAVSRPQTPIIDAQVIDTEGRTVR